MSVTTELASPQNLDTIYLRIARDPSLWALEQTDFLQTLCKIIAESLQVELVTVYEVDSDKDSIIQKNHFVLSKQKHYSGMVLAKSDYPVFFEGIKDFRIFESADAKNDLGELEFHQSYILQFNIGALLDCTMHHAGRLVGLLCAEHVGGTRVWSEDEKRFLSSLADLVSQRLSTLKVQEEKEERYRLIFENSGDGLFLMKGGVFVDCNQAALDIFACTREQILHRIPLEFIPTTQPDGLNTRAFIREKIKAALAGTTQHFELMHTRLDGTLFSTETTLNRVEVNGEPLILTSLRDISLRKQAENEVALSREKIIQQNKSLALINELSNQLQDTYSLDAIFEKTIVAIKKALPTPLITIFTVDYEKQELHYKTGLKHTPESIEEFAVIPMQQSFHQQALETGRAIYIPDLEADQRVLPKIRESILQQGHKSMVSVPFIVQGQRAAVLFLHYKLANSVSPEDLDILSSISKTVSLALDNARTRSELAHMAHHDSLTGLGNRAYFHRQFEQYTKLAKVKNAALYLLDLDRFKEINDTLGHFTGDKILQMVGPRFKTLMQAQDFLISRLGGDEFIILVYGINNDQDAGELALAVLDCLRKPFVVDELSLEIDASIGIALYPKDGKDSHALLRSADVAMYQAKQTGKGYACYEPHNDIHTPQRLAMIAELGSSIKSGQLFLHYQPKIDLQSNKVQGFEALARWDHPRLGLLGPGMFVPLIEMSNSIFQLTEEVLHQALSQQKQWRKDGFNYSIAVNLSARNLIDERIIGLLKDLLVQYDTQANLLELEITETSLMHDAERAINYLSQISDLGIQLSIDDFGTGYSSLAYLHKLPLNKIKLDREFIMGRLNSPQGESIVKTIISLSKTLELDVVAEGVEDQHTLDKLRNMHCDQAQGYHICKPNSWENIEHWLKHRNRRSSSAAKFAYSA